MVPAASSLHEFLAFSALFNTGQERLQINKQRVLFLFGLLNTWRFLMATCAYTDYIR